MPEQTITGTSEANGIAQRYLRHVTLPGVGMAGQRKLQQARVLIVGLGGLGCPAALYLNAAGVGTLGLADFDTVEESNLQRQVIYTEQDVGADKLDCAERVLRERNSATRLIRHPSGIQPDNARQLVAAYDLVLDGTDNFPTRYLLNDATYFAGVPLISASMFQFETQLTIFHPGSGNGCYRCLYPDMPSPGEVPNCAEAGIFGALPGIAGALQAIEVIKLITGVGEPLIGRLLVLDALTQQPRRIRIPANPNCALCGANPSIREIDATRYAFDCAVDDLDSVTIEPDAAAQLSNALFLDVRESFEWDLCHIQGAVRMPLHQIGARQSELPGDRPLVVYCHKGVRSLTATRQLRSAGFQRAVSLAGGIDRWAKEMDASIRRY